MAMMITTPPPRPDGDGPYTLHDGLWWPADDAVCHGLAEAELRNLRRALDHVQGRWQAVQAGGNVGQFPRVLCERFDQVFTFEPHADNMACLRVNAPDAIALQAGLGERAGLAGMMMAGSNCGAHWLVGDGPVPVLPLDALGLTEVSFLQLDIEGGEMAAIRGAAATIGRCRPVIMVEDCGHSLRYGVPEGAVVQYLVDRWGYRVVDRLDRDVVLVP